jgi:hypothetical protein
METNTLNIDALLKVDDNLLPGIPEFADVTITDNLKREEDPEVYDAIKEGLTAFMNDMNSGDDEPLPLSYYSRYVTAFSEGYRAARAKYQPGA